MLSTGTGLKEDVTEPIRQRDNTSWLWRHVHTTKIYGVCVRGRDRRRGGEVEAGGMRKGKGGGEGEWEEVGDLGKCGRRVGRG